MDIIAFFKEDCTVFSVENRLHDTGMNSGSYSAVVQSKTRFDDRLY